MTGPWHYREAEALLRTSLEWFGGFGPEDMTPAERLARKNADVAAAQVHATLALAAATALSDAPQGGMGGNDWEAWHDTVSVDATKISEDLT